MALNDLTSIVAGDTAYPPIGGGAKAFNGSPAGDYLLARRKTNSPGMW